MKSRHRLCLYTFIALILLALIGIGLNTPPIQAAQGGGIQTPDLNPTATAPDTTFQGGNQANIGEPSPAAQPHDWTSSTHQPTPSARNAYLWKCINATYAYSAGLRDHGIGRSNC